MLKRTNYLTKVYGLPEGWKLAAYEREARGYEAARRVLTTMQPADAYRAVVCTAPPIRNPLLAARE